jgi:hypothetical protein
MNGIWNVLEERTRTWEALGRQGLADAIWDDYISVKFGRTGDPRALEYLYPYLNHANRHIRYRAVEVAARAFEGRGRKAIGDLDYFTKNRDPFLRDRSVQVIGAALSGLQDSFVLEELSSYLNHKNQFIRRQAVVALGAATAGRASQMALNEIQRVARRPGPWKDEVNFAIATAFTGRPTEEVYKIVAEAGPDHWDWESQHHISILVRGASDEWYERACKEFFEPLLHAPEDTESLGFVQRDGIGVLCYAAPRRGMDALNRMLHLRSKRITATAMLNCAQYCFAGADPQVNREPLFELVQNGDMWERRIAAVCLGRMMMGREDAETISLLVDLCDAKNSSVRCAALIGLGMAARSTCDEKLWQLCLKHALDYETARDAIRTLGMIFMGSGRSDVFQQIRDGADVYRRRPVKGRRYCKPLTTCYWATGLLYLGTGSTEPVEFLLDVLALPQVPRTQQYQWSAAKALVMIEFSEPAIARAFSINWPPYLLLEACTRIVSSPWIGMLEYAA